jgi:hypothetical protein
MAGRVKQDAQQVAVNVVLRGGPGVGRVISRST